MHEKLIMFHIDNILLEMSVHWPSEEIGSRSKLGFMRNLQKNVTVISRKNHAKQKRQAATYLRVNVAMGYGL